MNASFVLLSAGEALFLHIDMLGIHLGLLLLLLRDHDGVRIWGNGRWKEEQMPYVGFKNMRGHGMERITLHCNLNCLPENRCFLSVAFPKVHIGFL